MTTLNILTGITVCLMLGACSSLTKSSTLPTPQPNIPNIEASALEDCPEIPHLKGKDFVSIAKAYQSLISDYGECRKRGITQSKYLKRIIGSEHYEYTE